MNECKISVAVPRLRTRFFLKDVRGGRAWTVTMEKNKKASLMCMQRHPKPHSEALVDFVPAHSFSLVSVRATLGIKAEVYVHMHLESVRVFVLGSRGDEARLIWQERESDTERRDRKRKRDASWGAVLQTTLRRPVREGIFAAERTQLRRYLAMCMPVEVSAPATPVVYTSACGRISRYMQGK